MTGVPPSPPSFGLVDSTGSDPVSPGPYLDSFRSGTVPSSVPQKVDCGRWRGLRTPPGYAVRMTHYARLDPGMEAARNDRTVRTGTVPERFRTSAPGSPLGDRYQLVLGDPLRVSWNHWDRHPDLG